MRKLRALQTSEKWIVALTLLFVMLMLGIYFRSVLMDTGGSYTVRGGAFSSENVGGETPLNWQVDINNATEAELRQLPGVGEVLAERIVRYREENGPFAAAEDLLQVEGIGESKLEEMKDMIVIGEAKE